MKTPVSVFCIWRDCEEFANRTLRQLEDIESLNDYDFSYYFYENDSKDKTVEILRNWMSTRKGGFLFETLNEKKFGSVSDLERMDLLTKCRNKCKALCDVKEGLCLLIDSDIIFNKENFLQQKKTLELNSDAVMVTPNVRQKIPDYTFEETEDSYYDIFAFRDRHGNNGVYFADCPSYNKQDLLDWKSNKEIRCCSSFGGFALIKAEVFNKVKWSYDIASEHVNFCFDILKFGSIYCDPKSKVYTEVGTEKINIEACKGIAKQQLNTFNSYFNK